jgi:hypothetical protein
VSGWPICRQLAPGMAAQRLSRVGPITMALTLFPLFDLVKKFNKIRKVTEFT